MKRRLNSSFCSQLSSAWFWDGAGSCFWADDGTQNTNNIDVTSQFLSPNGIKAKTVLSPKCWLCFSIFMLSPVAKRVCSSSLLTGLASKFQPFGKWQGYSGSRAGVRAGAPRRRSLQKVFRAIHWLPPYCIVYKGHTQSCLYTRGANK